MKKLLLSLLFIGTLFTSLPTLAQSQNWDGLLSSGEIKKAYTYKNSTTYALLKRGGMLVLNHATKKVTLFNKYNSPLPSNLLNDIVVTSDSTVYIGSDGSGLIKIKNGKYETIFGSEVWTSANVSCVALAPNGDVWFSGSGFEVFKINATGSVTPYASVDGATIGDFSKMLFKSTGEIWAVGTWGIGYFNGSVWSTYKPQNNGVYDDVALDANGHPWIASYGGLITFANSTWTTISNPSGYTWLTDVFFDGSGNVVICDFSVWRRYNPTNGSWSSFVPRTSPYDKITQSNNHSILVSTPNGFTLETPLGDTFFPYHKGVPFRGQPNAMLMDSNDNLWIGTNSDGLYRISKKDTVRYSYSGGFSDSQVYSLAEDKKTDRVYIGGPNRLHYFQNDSIYEVTNPAFTFYGFYDILVDDDNSIWCPSSQGLFHISKTDTLLYSTTNSPIPSNQLKRIEKDKQGNFWISSDLGMIRFNGVNDWFLFTPTNSTLPGTYINDMEKDAFGNIWIGLMNYGNNSLCVWDGTGFTSFDIDPSENEQAHVMDVAIDKYGNKWLATQNYSLARFDGNSATYYTPTNSGVPDKYLYAASILPSGKLLIGSQDLVVSYNDPADYLDTSNVRGIVFNDANGNSVLDGNEQKLPFARLKIWGSQKVIYANGNGEFSISLKADDYLIGSKETAKWNVVGTVLPITVSDNKVLRVSIPFQAVTTVNEAEISISGGFPRCNTDVMHILDVRNDGTKIQNAIVKLVTAAPVVSMFPIPSVVDHDTLQWTVQDILPGQALQFRSLLTLPAFDGDFKAFAQVDFYDANNIHTGTKKDSLAPEIRCAYDPNDKTANPKGVGDKKYLLIAKPIEYLIRFQNTGNDTAFNVTVVDTLSPLLDYASFEYLGASHKVEVSQEDSLISFHFPHILLPDSTTNEKGSHGYALFRIQPKATVAENSELNNSANIYFDFNPAIVTNVTSNILVSKYPAVVTGLFDSHFNSTTNSTLYPNPAKDYVIIETKDTKSGWATVYNIEGKPMSRTEMKSGKAQISTADLHQGIYTVKIETDQQTEQIKFIK